MADVKKTAEEQVQYDPQYILQVKDLKKYYNRGAIKALDGVTVDIDRGDVMVVIGPSGSGKSTFLRSLNLLEEPTGGYDPSIDYDALNGETVSCAATPAPHCEILEVCKQILADKGITLDIQEYDDYVIPNTIVEDGQCDTNYFQHQPYLDNFNEEKGTHLVSVAGIHVEPMGIYGGKQSDLSPIEG